MKPYSTTPKAIESQGTESPDIESLDPLDVDPGRPYSTTPKAIASRQRRLLDDEAAARDAERSRKANGRKRIVAIRARSEFYTTTRRGEKPKVSKDFVRRVRWHLSKGRDAGDIATREFARISRVLEAIELAKREAHE